MWRYYLLAILLLRINNLLLLLQGHCVYREGKDYTGGTYLLFFATLQVAAAPKE